MQLHVEVSPPANLVNRHVGNDRCTVYVEYCHYQPGPCQKVDKVDKFEKVDKVDKVDRVDKVEKVDKVDKVDKVEKNCKNHSDGSVMLLDPQMSPYISFLYASGLFKGLSPIQERRVTDLCVRTG